MSNSLSFPDRHAFAQAAFDHVAQVVADYAETVIVGGFPSLKSEECLKQLEVVSSQWGYSSVRITALIDIIESENLHLQSLLDELGDDHD